MKSDILSSVINSIKYRFNLDEDKASEDEVIENIEKGVEFKGINLWTLIFAIFIASIGLNVNSTAVIIGAMLISPLMGPIMGVGLGAGIFDFELIKLALKNLLIATAIGLLTSTVYFFISPLHQAQSELLARTSPTIWDVLIAFLGGLAGIVASSRKKYNNVIPGVAIATALMPPLCTAGYGIATGQWGYFFGAFYLYLINSVFISIATFLIVRFLKFKPHAYVNLETSAKVKKWVGIIAILTILPSIYLAYDFVRNEIFKQNADELILKEISLGGLTVLNNRINPPMKEISVTILDYDKVDSLKNILEIRKINYNLGHAFIHVTSNRSKAMNELSLGELKNGIIEDLFKKQEDLLAQKNEEINILKQTKEEQTKFDEKKKGAIEEFYALYGKPNELIIEKTILHNLDTQDTVLFVYIKPKDKALRSGEIKSMQNWLKTKFEIKTVRILNF